MNIYVGNLSYELTEEELRNSFAEHGEVTRATIITDKFTGKSKGFGFVEMTNDAEAEAAIKELDGASLAGRNVRVNQARPREERPDRNRSSY